MKKYLGLLLALILAFAVFSAWADETYTGTAKGFGGDVTVVLTCKDGIITDVSVTGEMETKEFGGAALPQLATQILEKQGADIDGVAGASVTSAAVRDAAALALREAAGNADAEPVTVADGVYTGTAMGFMSEVTTDVTLKDGKIEDIAVTSIADTGMIGNTAAAMLADEIVRTQSLAVDSITGATVTSGGVLIAVANALESAGADILAYKNVPVEKRAAITEEKQADVVVIGAGIAGITAAITAAENGADVILLEKQGVFGGSTTRSEGMIMGAGTDFQAENGVEDSADAMFADMMAVYNDEPTLDVNLLRKTVDESGPMINWYLNHGVQFEHLEAISAIPPRHIRRSHVSYGAGDGLMEKMVAAAQSNDKITILMKTPAIALIQENGAVVGVKATNTYGDDITIHAANTILCAGSYGGNMDLLAELNPNITAISYTGSGDGDGWTLAKEAGAKMIDIGYMAGSYMYFPYGYWDGAAVLPGSPTQAYFNTIQVDSKGTRLVNEDAFTFDYGDPLFDNGDQFGWSIVGKAFDEAHPELYLEGLDDRFTVNGKEYCITYKADTLDELAELTGMDASTLKATVERYNASCDAGVDEEFGKDPQYMERVDAPYVAYMLTAVVSDGYSGCAINEKAQVLDEEGNAIPGFYAAGACALPQIIGNRYFGCGSLIMTSGVFGHIAGEQAAK